MAKKSIVEQFRDFVNASSAQSNKPMTRKEIATVEAKKKSKASRAKAAAKKTTPKKTAKKSKKAKKAKRG